MSEIPEHYVHYLILSDLGAGLGWYAPWEVDEADSYGGVLTIPVSGGSPFDEYVVEVVHAGAAREPEMHILTRLNDTEFSADIHGIEINLRVFDAGELALPHNYIGNLHHDDFACKLLAIQPVENGLYDIILDKLRGVLIGCDPFRHYTHRDGSPLSDV